MTTEYSSCDPCEWRPLAAHPAVRDEPWAEVDRGYTYSYCPGCGNLTIHSYNPSTGFGQVYMLDASAMTLLRPDASPGAVLAYLYSDDFARNRGVTLPLFGGYLRSLVNLSPIANRLVVAVEQADELERIAFGLDALHATLEEAAVRPEQGRGRAELSVTTVAPVVRVGRGGFQVARYEPDAFTSVRLKAWNCLELFGRPGLWGSLEADTAEMLEEITDHLAVIRSAQHGLERGLDRLEFDGAVYLYVEAKFLQRVLSRRGARLTPALASLVWRVLQELGPRIKRKNSSTRPFDQRAFVRVRALLEHHIVSLGFEKSGGERTQAGLLEYVDPRTGRSLQLPPYRTRIYLYERRDAATPVAVLDEWDQLAGWLRGRGGTR